LWDAQHAAKFHRAGYDAMMKVKDLSASSKKTWVTARDKLLKSIREKSQPAMVNAALSEKSKEKRKRTFEAIGHQQGTKNSMSGKVWMTKDGISKPQPKIRVEELQLQGWSRGRILKQSTAGWDSPPPAS